MIDISKHPCFDDKARNRYGRLHLPVAPKCNIQCNFCNRKYDCAGESRPGVTSSVLSPAQALSYVGQVVAKDPRITVVGIAGPGDPFANAPQTMETLRRVRKHYPDMLLCVASNGLEVEPWTDELARLQTSHVSLTVSAVDSAIGEKIYKWVRFNKRVYRGMAAGRVLLENQLKAIRALKHHGVTVKINTIIIPGVNEDHAVEVAKVLGQMGADIQNCMPLCPVEDTEFGHLPEPAGQTMERIRAEAGNYIAQMTHCRRCRADAAGLLGEGLRDDLAGKLRDIASGPLDPDQERPYVAVASQEGFLVNQHLGEAERLLIFTREKDRFKALDSRSTPPPGGGDRRWQTLAETLCDCRAVLVSGAGRAPQDVLAEAGVRVIVAEGLIDECLKALYSGQEVRSPARPFKCGAGCTGDGTGCG